MRYIPPKREVNRYIYPKNVTSYVTFCTKMRSSKLHSKIKCPEIRYILKLSSTKDPSTSFVLLSGEIMLTLMKGDKSIDIL